MFPGSGGHSIFRKILLWHLIFLLSIFYYEQLSEKIKVIGQLSGKTEQNQKIQVNNHYASGMNT